MKRLIFLILTLSPLLTLAAETRRVTGVVLDAADGAPLVGATVFIDPKHAEFKDYNPQGTVTDAQGRFDFTLPDGVKSVVVSYLGYEALTAALTARGDYTFRIAPSENEMEAVVVTGYQKIEKRKLTSSIATVGMDEINRTGVASVGQMLEGQLAGVVSTSSSGAPGAGNAIKIRSTVTINGTTDPLWVLDGMPLEGNEIPKEWTDRGDIDNLYNMSIAGLNPEDIENITVLKDAAATAIYGARAANGVIIITTKKGRRNQAPKINLSAATFITAKPDLSKLNLMNASEKVDLELQMAANGRLNYLSGMGGVARILDAAGERDKLVQGGFNALSPSTQIAIDMLRRDGTSFADEVYRTAVNQQYSLSVAGGGDRIGYYFSAGYYNEQGTTRGTGFERFNLTLKTDFDLAKNLRLGVGLFGNQNKNNSFLTDKEAFLNPNRYTRTVNPYLNAYDANGNYVYDPDMAMYQKDARTLDFNYLEEMAGTQHELKTRSLKSLFDLDYTPVKGLKLYTQLGLQMENGSTEKSARENTYYTRKYAELSRVKDVIYLPKGGVIQNWNSDFFQYTWKAQAEYAKTFAGSHDIDLMGGLEMRGATLGGVHTKGFGYDHKTLTTKPIIFPETAGKIADSKDFRQYEKSFSENRYLSYFMTGSYTYDNRYTFFGSFRYDGTNLFGVDPKYKFNPMWSVSGAWNADREKFLRDVKWLSNLRLRASYGVQGNIDRSTSPYILGTWSNTSLGGSSEDNILVTSPPNQNLRWETTYTWNTALDLGLWNSRVNMTVDLYGRRSKDLITQRAIPHENGFTFVPTNYGEISSRGVEVAINTVNIDKPNFRWESSLNLAHNRDRVEKILIDEKSWTPSLLGHSTSSVFAIRTAGLDDKGMPLFWKNGQKVGLQEFVNFRVEFDELFFDNVPKWDNSAADTRAALSYVGNRDPKVAGGFNNRFFWKGLDLTVSMNFAIKQTVSRTPFYSPHESGPGVNYTRDMHDVWSPSNPGGTYPSMVGANRPDGTPWGDWSQWDDNRVMHHILNQYEGINFWNSLDIWQKEMSYLRINSIRLGYSLPQKWVQKLRFASARVSLEARNPFVIATDYKGYFDPETYGSPYAQPLPRTFSVGLNLTF